MLSRRAFVGGLAVAVATPHVALAQKPQRFQPGPELAPRIVALDEYLPAGEIHVDPNLFALYLTLPDYKAWRYTVAVSKPALWEPGTYHVKWMAEWPRWRPTNEMIRRNPAAYAKYRSGMPGGANNPLGARAIYLFDGPRDTYLRIHGTNQPWTVGTASSNGCARMINEHVIHLVARVQRGAKVVLHPRWGGDQA